jgi:hypothetical protein
MSVHEWSDGMCHVYIIAHMVGRKPVAPVKVGISSSPEKRLATLQTANPKPLVLLCTFATPNREMAKVLESAFHEVRASDRLAGEWFNIHPMIAVKLMCDNVRGAFRHFLGSDPEVHDIAVEFSGLRANEEKLAQWAAATTPNTNDNAGPAECQ